MPAGEASSGKGIFRMGDMPGIDDVCARNAAKDCTADGERGVFSRAWDTPEHGTAPDSQESCRGNCWVCIVPHPELQLRRAIDILDNCGCDCARDRRPEGWPEE